MTKPNPKYRRPLNNHQILILNTLYKFRFATATLIAESQKANHVRVISSRLKILVDQEYIGMNYDSSYKIKGKPATYYLLTEAVRFLRQQAYTDESTLRSIYHDKRAKEAPIQHRLHVFKVYIHFKHTYPGRFKFYSKSELVHKDFLPRQRPDAYLIDTESDKHYLLDCLEDTMSFWTLRKNIKRFIRYAELEIWQKNQDSEHPAILLVCESEKLKKQVQNLVNKELDNSFAELQFALISNLEYIDL
jgi:hypothetical protein